MNSTLAPNSLNELVEAVRTGPRLLAMGAQTKSRLCAVDCVKLSTKKLCGMLEYEPTEFTFTALAGTPVRDIASALAEFGQYLPFDPMLTESGATLGGTVASGLSGPGRFRFGALRDFILGVRFVDGAGRLLHMGGKVVKNAAGYDLPKFLVGSLGRFGVLAEIAFKVFPHPASRLTLRFDSNSLEEAVQILIKAANARWELEALDLLPGGKNVCLRLAGPVGALDSLAREILDRWRGEVLPGSEADALWAELGEFRWIYGGGLLLKVPLIPEHIVPLYQAIGHLAEARIHVSVGGNVAYISFAPDVSVSAINEALRALRLTALTLRGEGPLWWNIPPRTNIASAVKHVLDAENRFPSLDD